MTYRCATLLLALSLTWVSSAAEVPSGDPVVSLATGTRTFITVTEDQAKSGKSKAGLYRKDKSSWLHVIPGPLLTNSEDEPVLRQLELGQLDKSGLMIIVSDGYLHLITNYSDPKKAETIFKVGSNELPLKEVTTGQKRLIPAVTDADNISIYAHESTKGGVQVVLVSMKFEGSNILGEGMTYAFAVKSNPKRDKIELQLQPRILDYKFRSPESLASLIVERSNGQRIAYSQNLVEQFEAQLEQNEADLTAQLGRLWDNFLSWSKEKVTELLSPESALNEDPIPLAYDLIARKPINNIQFRESWAVGFELEQVFSPVQGRGELEIHGADVKIPGVIEMNGSEPLAMDVNGSDGVGALLVFMSDATYLVFENGNFLKLEVKGLPPAESVRKISMFMTDEVDGIRNITMSFELNDKNGVRGITQVVNLENVSDDLTTVSRPYTAIEAFVPQDQLEARHSENQEGQWLFDSLSKVADTVDAYTMTANAQAPKLSLSTSNADNQVFQYVSAEKVARVSDGLYVAFYPETPKVTNPTGIYVTDDPDEITGLEKNAVRGQILVRNLKEDEKVDELPDRRLPLVGMTLTDSMFGESSRNVSVFAVDPNRKNGKDQFVLAFASNVSEGGDAYRLAVGQPNFRFNELVGVKLFRGKKSNSNKLYLLLSGNADGKDSTSLITLDLMKLSEHSGDGPLMLQPARVVYDGAMDDTDLSSRVVYSEEGAPYFVRTIDVPNTSTKYEVTDLNRFNLVKPALLTGQNKINFMTEEEAKDGDETFGSMYLDKSISWKVYKHEAENMFDKKPELVRDLSQFESFKELIAELNRMANPDATPERRIMVLPESLRDLIWDFIGAVYLADDGNKNGFNKANFKSDLSVFQHPKSHQDSYLANFEYYKAKRKSSSDRQMLIAKMSEIHQNFHPAPSQGEGFVIEEISGDQSGRAGTIAKSKTKRHPHGLYLMASETPRSLEDFKKEKPEASVPSLILATPEEMAALESHAAAEVDAGLLDAFRITEIKNPDRENMFASLSQIFNDEDVKKLETVFDASDIRKNLKLSPEESFATVLEYMISRFEALVEQKKQSTFESFMRLRSTFSGALFSDRQFRRTKKLDKFFVERVLTQIFDIPVNLSTLPEDDPLQILSRRDAALKLQEAGYAGPFDLKQKVFRVILSQTQADAGKPIPSSLILFGETGAGKTFLFKTLTKMLGLKMYDFNHRDGNDVNAGAMVINVGQLSDSGMTVDSVLAHADMFLGNTNGRGFLLIDDAHANSDAIKGRILAWVRNIFESPNGMFTLQSGRKIPVRNLTIMMTLNPTADQQQIKKYAKDESKPTTEERIIATLSSDNFKVEPSLLKRWGAILSLDLMPAGAKGPELINALGSASREQLTTSGRIGLVDPRVVSQIVGLTTTLDARTFLSATVSELMSAVNDAQSTGAIAMVVPSRSGAISDGSAGPVLDANLTPAEQIRNWVKRNTRVIGLDKSIDGRLSLMKLVVDAYRTPVYEFFVDAIMSDPRFAGDEFSQKRMLTPILLAINDHIALRSSVPLRALNLSPSDFSMKSQRERENFRDIIDRMTDDFSQFIPITFGQGEGSANIWQSLLNKGQEAPQGRSRRDVIYASSEKIARLTEKHLNRILNTEDALTITDEAAWMGSLPASDHKEIRRIGKDLADAVWEFLPEILDEQLKEPRNGSPAINSYAAARLFLFALDRAILKLPWVNVNNLMLKSLDLVSQDQVLSQLPGIQGFMFTNRYRLLKPTTPDLINQIVESSSAYQEISPEYRQRLRSEFNDNCSLLLTIPTGEGKL